MKSRINDELDDGGELREYVLKEAQKIAAEMDEGKWVSQEEIEFYFR